MLSTQKKNKKKTPTTLSFNYITLSFNYICQIKLGKKSIIKESERLTLLPSGHGGLDGVISLDLSWVWSPDQRASVQTGAGSMCQEM